MDLLKIARRVASSHKRVSLDSILDVVKQQCPENLRNDIGKFLGRGSFGEVYEIDGGDKVIKIAVAGSGSFSTPESEANRYLDKIKALSELNTDVFVGVYDYGILCNVDPPYPNRKGVAYYYVMDKLIKVPDVEAKIAAKTLEDLFDIGNQGIGEERENNINRYLTFKEKVNKNKGDIDEDGPNPIAKAYDLYKRMRASRVRHEDIHKDNIMQDADGKYKLIDLEASKILNNRKFSI